MIGVVKNIPENNPVIIDGLKSPKVFINNGKGVNVLFPTILCLITIGISVSAILISSTAAKKRNRALEIIKRAVELGGNLKQAPRIIDVLTEALKKEKNENERLKEALKTYQEKDIL